MTTTTEGKCAGCGRRAILTPLHGPEKGGPLRCYVCAGAWQAEHTRKRRAGHVVFRAIKAFMDAGGSTREVDHLKVAADSIHVFGEVLFIERLTGPLPTLSDDDTILLTSEVLADALRLTHPDAHPPERHELANRVTQQLLALQPFVFPAQKPKPPIFDTGEERNGSSKNPASSKEPLRPRYPCAECASTESHFYCTTCRTEWERRIEEGLERDRAKQRKWYARRKARQGGMWLSCLACGKAIKDKRKDARYCTDACRQRAHRKAKGRKLGPRGSGTAKKAVKPRSINGLSPILSRDKKNRVLSRSVPPGTRHPGQEKPQSPETPGKPAASAKAVPGQKRDKNPILSRLSRPPSPL
jgi:hypothetical protein